MIDRGMMMILGILLAATLIVSLLLGYLAKLPMNERLLQTAAMAVAALAFFGLVVLIA